MDQSLLFEQHLAINELQVSLQNLQFELNDQLAMGNINLKSSYLYIGFKASRKQFQSKIGDLKVPIDKFVLLIIAA